MKYIIKEREEVEAEQLTPYVLWRGYEILAWLGKNGYHEGQINPLFNLLEVNGESVRKNDWVVLSGKEARVMTDKAFKEKYETF